MAHSQGTRQKPPQVFLCKRQKHPQGCLAPNKIEACAFFLLQTRQKPPQVCFGPKHDRSQRRVFLTTQRPMQGFSEARFFSFEHHRGIYRGFRPQTLCLRALPTETKVESGTSQRKRGTSVNLSNGGEGGTGGAYTGILGDK